MVRLAIERYHQINNLCSNPGPTALHSPLYMQYTSIQPFFESHA